MSTRSEKHENEDFSGSPEVKANSYKSRIIILHTPEAAAIRNAATRNEHTDFEEMQKLLIAYCYQNKK